MKKQEKTGRAPKPLGAASHEHLMTPAQKLDRLKSMADKMGLDKKQKAEFFKQGREAIENDEVRHKHADRVTALLEDVQTVMKKHGVSIAHVLVKVDISPKEREAGINGWASTIKDATKDGSGFELIGALTNSVQNLSSSRFKHKSF